MPNVPLEISEATMRKGLSLIEYFIPHARKAFDCMGEAGEVEEYAKYLWVKLKALRESFQQDYFTKQIVWRVVRGKFKTAEPFDAAIKILIERNYIKVIKDQNGEADRNANLIFLNPMAIMAKITNKTNEEHKKNNSSHYSHDILQVENMNLIESDPLQSIEDESLDILI